MIPSIPVQGKDFEFTVVSETGICIPEIVETAHLQRAGRKRSLGLCINYPHLASGALAIPIKNPILISLNYSNPYKNNTMPELLIDDTGRNRKGGFVLSLDLMELDSCEGLTAANTSLWLGTLALAQKLSSPEKRQNTFFADRAPNLLRGQVNDLSGEQNMIRAALLAEESPVLENLYF